MKVQEREERAAEKKAKEDARRQEIRAETAAWKKKSKGDVYARKVVERVILIGLQSNNTDIKKLTYKQVADSSNSNR
jgi:DNA-binding SARP family transcriptional activator